MPNTSQPGPGLTYAAAGVDLDKYDSFIRTIGPMIRRTHTPRVIDNPGGFAGLFRLDYNEQLFKRNYKNPVLVACSDGVGTKLKIAQELKVYNTVGIDLVAMSVNDLIVQGAEPLFFLDYIAIHAVDKARDAALLEGIAKGCEMSGAALLGGETAEMGDLYKPGEFDLAGFAVGVVELHRATDPLRVHPGDIVLGLASSGVHSNGYSLVRKIVDHASLDLAKAYPELGPERTLGQELLEPTRIYAAPIVRLQRSYRVKKVISGMAHITGGGLADNLARVLPDKVDAELVKGSWDIPPVFGFLQKHGSVDDAEMDRVFNMGVGYCVIVRPTFAASVTRRLERLGERVFQIGRIVEGGGKVRMVDA